MYMHAYKLYLDLNNRVCIYIIYHCKVNNSCKVKVITNQPANHSIIITRIINNYSENSSSPFI